MLVLYEKGYDIRMCNFCNICSCGLLNLFNCRPSCGCGNDGRNSCGCNSCNCCRRNTCNGCGFYRNGCGSCNGNRTVTGCANYDGEAYWDNYYAAQYGLTTNFDNCNSCGRSSCGCRCNCHHCCHRCNNCF